MSGGEAILIFFIILIILLLLGWLLWELFIKKHGESAGGPCTNDKDCGAGLYCGGNNSIKTSPTGPIGLTGPVGICVAGPHGATYGGYCKYNSDCGFPMLCFSGSGSGLGVCWTGPTGPSYNLVTGPSGPSGPSGSSLLNNNLLGAFGPNVNSVPLGLLAATSTINIPGGTLIPSFKDKLIKSQDEDMTHLYLNVAVTNTTTSQWVTKFNHQVFSYDAMTNTLSVKISGGDSMYVAITNAGNLVTTKVKTTNIYFVEMKGMLFMVDKYNNSISIGTNNFANLAVFVNRSNYPSNPVGIENNSIVVDICLKQPHRC
jgi:hypothetical protein